MTGMVVHQDDRFANPIRIGNLVVGVNRDGILGREDVALAAGLNPALAKAGEIRQATQLLPTESVARLDALEPGSVAIVHKHLVVVTQEGRRIRKQSATASFVQPAEAQSAWVQQEDLALAAKFAAMNVAAQTQICARAMASPAEYRRWVEMLLRVAPELSGVDLKLRDQLRLALLEQFDPALLDSIQVQLEQLAQSERAQAIAEQVLAETFHGSLAKLRAMPVPAEPARTAFEQVPGYVIADLLTGGGKLTMRAPIERVQ